MNFPFSLHSFCVSLWSMGWNVLLIPPRPNQGWEDGIRWEGHGGSFLAGLLSDGFVSSGLDRCLMLTFFLVGFHTAPPGH